jgi:pimeloyl-ACP methyl ester carboxylesterase
MRTVSLFVVLACLPSLCAATKVERDFDAGAYASPGRMVDVGGRKLNLLCKGSGSPTVVFESALGGPGWDWAPVHAAVAHQSRACIYDRAGLGFSDPSNRPGTTVNAAEDLAALLRYAGEHGPYVLVGASYGSMIARLFAAKHPSDVSALVLVDGHHEDEFERINKLSSGRYAQMMAGWEKSLQDCATASRRGLQPGSKDFKTCVAPPPAFADRKLSAAHLAQSLTPHYWDSTASEMENIHAISSQQMRDAKNRLGQVPVLALVRSISPFDTPGKRPSALSLSVEKENAVLQKETADLSQAGRIRVVAKASHAIHMDNPSAVTAAVLEFVTTRPR